MAKTKVKVIVALFAVIALSLLAVCFGRLFSPAEAKAADGTYDDAAAFALMTALATNDEVTLTQDVVFDLTVPSRITGSGTMKENGHMDIVGNKTIDLAGFTLTIITGSENFCVEVTPNASLTIKDSSAAGTGKVVGQSAGDFAWGQTGTSISLTNVDVEFTSTETGAAGDEGTTPGGSSEDHVILSNGSVELSGVTFDTNVSDPVAVFTKNAETGEFVGSDVTYGTLQDAINASETSITLDRDYTESITVSKGQNVTIDLNGFTLTNVANEHTVTNYGTLTVKDGSEEKTGTVDNVSNGCGSLVNYGVASVNSGNIVRGETAQGSWYVIKNYGYMTLGTNAQSAVKVDTNSDNSSLIANGYFDGTDKEANESSITVTEKARTLVINGGTYTNGMNAVKNDDEGVLTINNGSFTNNYTEPGYNGAVILTAGTMNINGGKFTQINGSSHGIRITTSGDDVKVNIGGGEFSEYAGVYLMHERNSTGGKLDVTISGGTFDGKIETDNVIGTAVSGTDTIAITGGTFNNDLSLGVEMDVAISGGDYKYIPNNDYLADEVKMYQYTEGAGAKNDLFVIVAPGEEQPENTVATGYVQAGKKGYYNTLAEALAAGESSVYLRADITESVTYTGGYLTIYLEGHTWTADGDQPALTNNNASSTLNIRSTKGYDGGAIVRTTPGPVIVNNNSLSFSTSSSGKYTVKNESNGDYALIENNGTISITSGSFDSASALFDNKTAGSKITIMSTANGTFTAGTNIVKNNLGTVKISAGTFNKTVDKEYIAAGYTSVNNGDGTFGVVKVVAQIVRGEETFDYTDFATAVAALQDNDTLIILASVSGGLTIDDGLTVTLEVYGTLSGGIINNGTLTIRGDGTVEGTVTNNNNASLKIESGEFESLFVANGKDISITGGTFKGGANEHDGDSYLRSIAEYLAEGYYFVSHSGTTGNMYTVGQCDTYAATVTDGDFTLNVGTLEVAAMYVRYSAATSDVTITLNDDVTPAKSIAFYQGGDSEAKNVTLDLNGHSVTFDSGKGFTVGGSSESQSHNITIEGSGKVDGTMTVKYGTLKIKGGTYTANVESYLAEGYVQQEDGSVILEAAVGAVAQIGDMYYKDLKTAIEAAAENATITLLADVTESVTIAADDVITLDLNGKTITNTAGQHTITNNGTLTIVGNGTVDNVSHGRAALLNNPNATMTVLGGTYRRTAENAGNNSFYVIQNKGTMTIGGTGASDIVVYAGATTEGSLALRKSSLVTSGWYSDAPDGGAASLTINSGSFYGGNIAIKCDEKTSLTINSGVFNAYNQAVQSWTNTKITNGTFNGIVAAWTLVDNTTGEMIETPSELDITGGTFNGAIVANRYVYLPDDEYATEVNDNADVDISGGEFSMAFNSDFLADNVNLYQTETGFAAATEQNAPENSTKVVAFVSDKAYDKLADAVAAATDDGAVTLYVDVKENITVASGTVTIDLAGNTLNGFIKSTGATVNVKNGTVSGSWIDGAVMANGEGASVTLTDTVIGNPISISNDGAVTLVRSTTRGRITVGSGSAPENYTAGTLTITDSIIEKEISVEMLGKVVISDTVEYKTSFASGVKVTAKDPAALEAFKGYGVTTVVHVANEEQLLKALELGVSEIEVQSMELSAPVEITKDVKIYGGNKGDHEIVGSFIVKGEIEVTIEDVSFAGDGTGAALTVTDGAKLTYSDNLSNVTVAVSGFEAGISVDGNSSATVNNITFENISAAAEVKDGKSDAVTFNGCTIPEDTAQYVAVVTDATNLASAIADSKFAKVTLGADVELTSALVIERSVTLDLNGYDITGNINVTAADVTITAPETSDSAINGIVTVTNADDFTLSNVTVNYTVTGEEEADSLKGAVVIDGSENATIDNVTVNVTANKSGLNVVSVWVKNDSTATISDSTIDLEFRATEENRTQGQVVRAETSDLTIKDSVITTTDYGVIFYGDMSATDAQADNTAAFDKLVIENSTVTVTDTDEIVGAYAVSGNGSNRNGTIIEITGSTITSDVATAIYHPQYGNMTITDSVITGASGIEMRSGNLTVTSGTITATGDFEVEPNGNGNTASGVAVAVSQHTTEMKINVQLNGGTFNATGENGKAFYETDTVTGADPSADVTVDLNGGTYEAAVEAKNVKNYINDGLYKEEPKEDAFAEGYEGVLYNGYYQVVEATTDDPAALLTAKTEAQADVRSYLLNACGMTIADVKALAADETLGAAAQAVIDAYAAMDGATSESKLAIARLSVMDAIDALDKALDTALADYKAAAIDEINSYGAKKDVAVPTATIMAINSAKTEAEVDMYKTYALSEIDDIVAYREAISNIEIPDYSDTLDALSDKLDTLTGNLASVSNDLGAKIDAVKTDIATVTADIDKLETTLAGLADSDDVNGIAEDISDIIEQLAAIKSTVDGISVAVDEATAVEEVKTEAAAEIDAWLEDYIDSIVESSATSVRDILTAKAAMADDLRSKLVDAFGEDNAALIEKYYDDAMSAIENATSASEATNAVSTFKAQVASVEAAAGNTTSLAGVYVLLAIILVVAIVAVVLAVVLKRKGGEPAPATAQPAPEAAPAPAPAAETAPAPAATEEAPAAQPEDESAATATDEDTERVVITASTRTFEEAYEALDPELRDLFDKVKAYALSKNGTTEVKLSNCICIKYGSKKVVRLTVRRSYPLAMFVIENEMVKDFRRNATGALKLKVPATELVIRDEEDLKAAYSMVDLAVDQILKDIEAAKERRRAARRARRAQREAEAGEAGESPEAPEAPDDGGKK